MCTFAVVGVMRSLVAADGSLVHAQLLVRVALPHRAPEPRIVRPQLQGNLHFDPHILTTTIGNSQSRGDINLPISCSKT